MYEGRNLGHDDAAPLQSRTSDVRCPILRFSDSPMPYNARSLRFGYDFLAFPSFSEGGFAGAWRIRVSGANVRY